MHRVKPFVSGGESKRRMPLVRKKKNYTVNGIWLFAGEGALYNASPSPKAEIENVEINHSRKEHSEASFKTDNRLILKWPFPLPVLKRK
jgi:hypothetical protein